MVALKQFSYVILSCLVKSKPNHTLHSAKLNVQDFLHSLPLQSCRKQKCITAAKMFNLVYINSPKQPHKCRKLCLRLCFSSPHLIIFFFPRWDGVPLFANPAHYLQVSVWTINCASRRRSPPPLPADLPRRMKGPSRFFSRRSGVGTLSRRHFCHHYRSAGRHRSGPAGGECGGSGRDLFIYLSVFFLMTDLSAAASRSRRRRLALRDPQNKPRQKRR